MSTPLQQEIGQAERALSALLVQHVLQVTPFGSTTEWVVANILADAPAELKASELQTALTVPTAEFETAIERMLATGAVVTPHGGIALSDSGRRAVRDARTRTAYVASRIEAAVSAVDRNATVRTLAAVRNVVASIRDTGIPTNGQ